MAIRNPRRTLTAVDDTSATDWGEQDPSPTVQEVYSWLTRKRKHMAFPSLPQTPTEFKCDSILTWVGWAWQGKARKENHKNGTASSSLFSKLRQGSVPVSYTVPLALHVPQGRLQTQDNIFYLCLWGRRKEGHPPQEMMVNIQVQPWEEHCTGLRRALETLLCLHLSLCASLPGEWCYWLRSAIH